MRPAVEVADVFRLAGEDYMSAHKVSTHQHKIIRDIQLCRTAALGGHVDECDKCGHLRISYNSCRNSHCPKCQSMAREAWLEKRKAELLPVKYFHFVFTLPSQLHDLVRYNERLLYGQLFKLAWQSLQQLANDKRYLGARTGMIAVLHTWGQNLHYHPHIHCIVPAGGLTVNGKWKKSHKDFFIPVKALSVLFRAKFIHFLRQAHRKNKLNLKGLCAQWASYASMNTLLNTLYHKDWVVYAKAPFAGPDKLMDYLGKYVKRVAISNHRLIAIDERNKRICFRWRDYSDGNKVKVMSLTLFEFIRRFLQHILPRGFMKVRYYGLFAHRDKEKRLAKCRRAMGKPASPNVKLISWQERFYRLTGIDPNLCPYCEQGRMKTIGGIIPRRAPPV